MFEQTINISALFEFIGLGLTIIISSIVITRAIKKGYRNYIDSEIKMVNIKIDTIEKEVGDNQKQNEKEHDRLTLLFDKIDGKLDRIIETKKN